MENKIKYIELKTGFSDNGPAWIAKVGFSKSKQTIYFNGRAFQSLKGKGYSANYFELESGDEYWISGVKKDGSDRHWAGSGKIFIDKVVLEDYLKLIGETELPKNKYEIIELKNDYPKEKINKLENEVLEPSFDTSLMYKKPSELSNDELMQVYNELLIEDISVTYLKARKMWKQKVKETKDEIDKRKNKNAL
jgi:hypothetical protein